MISPSVFSLSNRADSETIIHTQFIVPIIDLFFSSRGIEKYYEVKPKDLVSYDELDDAKLIYFYEKLLGDMTMSNQDSFVSYAITFDSSSVDSYCDVSHRQYSTIFLGEQPVFFYIYFEIDEINNFIKSKQLILSRPYAKSRRIKNSVSLNPPELS